MIGERGTFSKQKRRLDQDQTKTVNPVAERLPRT
jgi:hypothetical protein